MLLAAASWADAQVPDERLRELYPGFAQVYDSLTPRDQAKTETLRRFHAARSAIDGYRPDNPESFNAAWRALTTLYEIDGQKNLDNVFWLLDIGAIPPETSGRMAEVRNRMVERACEHVTRSEGGELHRIDFSPATNAKSDIDQTFRPVEKLKQTGPDLVATFDTMFQTEFGINPRHMDVVSHPFEARIPAWEADVQVHDFVVQLRRGSALLAGNEEAYFLEGAFRMQIDKRSFESEEKLYTVFTVSHGAEGDGVAKLDIAEPRVPIAQYRDTARKMVYRVRPSAQRSYAFGSAVGNWYFYVKHGKGTRYACKYGLRSFAEGAGWLALPAEPPQGQPLPKTYLELLKAPIGRADVFDAAWDKHYEGRFGLPKKELKWALETALEIRALGDKYDAEARARILATRAQELGGTVYKGNEEVFLSVAEKQLNSHLQRMMVFNMEICLPARLADYLEPKVSLRRLGYSREQIKQMSETQRAEVTDAATKRLRASALFETLHALHVMDPDARDNAIARAILRHPKFARTLEALQRMVKTKPVMLGVDIEARRELVELKKGQRDGTKVVVTDEVARVRELAREAETKLKADIDDMRRAVDAEVLVPISDPQTLSRIDAIGELKNRFDRAIDEARGALLGTAQFMAETPMRQVAINRMRRTVLESVGFEFRKEWKAIETIARSDYNFNARTLISNTVNLSNMDTLVNIARAYRDSNGDMEQVGNAILLEAAQRLPFVSPALQVKSFAGGDLWAGGILTATVLFPEIGPVVMVFGLAKNTIELGLDIQTDRAIEAYYQGSVPYADGSPGPAESFYVSGGRVIGILEPVFEKLRTHRAEMMQRAADPSTSPTERQEIQERLQKVYTPDADGAKRFLYEYYDPELEKLLEQDGVPREMRLAKKLSSGRPPILSNESEHILNQGNLPPELKAYIGRVLEDYRHGRNEYEPWAAAARNEVLQREWFFTTDHYISRQKWESVGTDLTVVLADMFANALIERGQGRAVQPRLHLDKWDAQHVKRYFEGCPGRALVPLRSPEAAVPPDAPSLLAPYPGTTQEERLKAFFEEHDRRLNEILRKRTPQPVPEEELDAFKLGLHHPDLTPEAPEEREVKYAFVVAFFMSRIDAYWRLPIHHREQGWLGDPLPNMDALRYKLAVQMSYDYVSGLLAAIGRRQQQLEREMQDAQLPHAVALERARATLLGGSGPLADEDPNAPPDNSILDPEAISAARAEMLDQLALVSDDPHLFADDDSETGSRDLFADSGVPRTAPASKVEIVLPSPHLQEGAPLKVQCRVSATDHYVRPFQCDWSIKGADGAKPSRASPRPTCGSSRATSAPNCSKANTRSRSA